MAGEIEQKLVSKIDAIDSNKKNFTVNRETNNFRQFKTISCVYRKMPTGKKKRMSNKQLVKKSINQTE